ncbi:MAG TPA: hypothetical protein VIH21_00005 [Dehalococcoidia bacterium]
MARTFLAGLLLTLAVLSAISANIVVWTNRTIFNTDRFVSTVQPALRDKDVQTVLSQRLSEELFVRGDAEDRIREQLPPRVVFLARPLTVQTQELVARVILNLLATELAGDVSTRLLTDVHSQVMAILDESQTSLVQRQNNEIVIDLRDLLVRAADDLGVGQNADIAQRINIPPDAGRVVIYEGKGNYQWVGNLIQHRNALTAGFVALTLIFFGLAILVSRNHRIGLRNAGFALAAAAIISLVALYVGKEIGSGYARNPDVAREVLDTVLRGLRYQALVMLLIGVVVAAGAALLGPSEVATSLRHAARPSSSADGERARAFNGFVREQQSVLRIAGLAIAAFALVIWPGGSAAVYITIIALLVLYLLAISIIGSDAPWAESARARFDDARTRYLTPASSDAPWIARHAMLLAATGIVIAVLYLVLTPDLTLRRFVLVLACTLVYLAAIDFFGRAKEPGRATPVRHR